MANKNIKAFPVLDPNSNFYNEGMTLRDYFAAKAMQSLISKISIDQYDLINDETEIHNAVPVLAYQVADEMLKGKR